MFIRPDYHINNSWAPRAGYCFQTSASPSSVVLLQHSTQSKPFNTTKGVWTYKQVALETERCEHMEHIHRKLEKKKQKKKPPQMFFVTDFLQHLATGHKRTVKAEDKKAGGQAGRVCAAAPVRNQKNCMWNGRLGADSPAPQATYQEICSNIKNKCTVEKKTNAQPVF